MNLSGGGAGLRLEGSMCDQRHGRLVTSMSSGNTQTFLQSLSFDSTSDSV